MLEAFHGVFRILDALPQLAIAAVDGRCLGGGCELAVFCDVVLATKRSVFAQPEIDVGCFPPVAAVVLPRLVGRAAFEMILTGAPVDAPRKRRASASSPAWWTTSTPRSTAGRRPWPRRAGPCSPSPGARCGRAVTTRSTTALARAERLYREELVPTADCEEGVRAFLEKRPPALDGPLASALAAAGRPRRAAPSRARRAAQSFTASDTLAISLSMPGSRALRVGEEGARGGRALLRAAGRDPAA